MLHPLQLIHSPSFADFPTPRGDGYQHAVHPNRRGEGRAQRLSALAQRRKIRNLNVDPPLTQLCRSGPLRSSSVVKINWSCDQALHMILTSLYQASEVSVRSLQAVVFGVPKVVSTPPQDCRVFSFMNRSNTSLLKDSGFQLSEDGRGGGGEELRMAQVVGECGCKVSSKLRHE